jgi:PAS domain-containing protein
MQELMKSEAQFRLLADSMPQFVWSADVHGKMNYFNKGSNRIFRPGR